MPNKTANLVATPSQLTEWAEQYRFALHKCGERYRDMLIAANYPITDDLWKFVMEFMFQCRDGYPIPKLCRWLGNIQGKLHERGLTTDEDERNWTRPLFRPLDFPSE